MYARGSMPDARRTPTTPGLADELPPALHYAGMLVRFLEEDGYARAALLSGSNVSEAQISNPRSLISLRDYATIVHNALRLTGDPALGLWFGRKLKLASMGVLGFAAISSPTLADAAQLLARFSSLRVHRLTPHVELPDPASGRRLAAVRLEESEDYGDIRGFLMESTIAFLSELAVTLLGRVPDGLSFDVTYERPAHWRDGIFPHPVRFGQPAHRIYGALDSLGLTLPNADRASASAMQRLLEERLAAQRVGLPLVERVREELERAYRHGGNDLPTAEQMADILGCSPRTLRRALSETEDSYRSVANEVRCEVAKRALTDRTESVAAIARRLGYRDTANFRRAFRLWTGLSPTEYRSALAAGE